MPRTVIAVRLALVALVALVCVLQWSIGYEIGKAAFFREAPKTPCIVFIEGNFRETPPPASAASRFLSLPDPVTDYRYSGDIAFALSRVGLWDEYALTVHNTGTRALTLRKSDFAFAGEGGMELDGTTPMIAHESTPWQEVVSPGATVRNEFGVRVPTRNGTADAIAVQWTIRGDLGAITVPRYDSAKQQTEKPFGFGLC